MTLNKAIFYIRYYATKHGETIERKAQLDGIAKGEYVCKKGYPCFNYLDIWATEKKTMEHHSIELPHISGSLVKPKL